MAGAGYKLFNTGDVLTAAQVNTYLMQQTVMVFASSAARTTALSGVLAEGMVSYLQDSNTLEVYDGSAWVGATGDITGLTAGTGITITNATGPVPTVTNDVVTTIDAKGDLIVGTGDNTYVRQAVGSNNQVLMADSAQSDGVKWANEATATLTAKGDILSASGANTLARLAVGNSGETIVADSSATTGLRYNPPVGSLANPVINGGFDIWQRGTSFAASASYIYTADRWQVIRGSGTLGATYSRQATNDTTNLPTIQYCMRVQRNSGNTATNFIEATSTLETANSIPYTGRAVTVSFYARAGANYSSTSNVLAAQLYNGTGTDQPIQSFTGANIPGSTTAILTTTWQRFVINANVPTNSTELAVRFTYDPTGTAGANDYFEVTGVQIDLGTYTASSAPAFRRSGGTLAGELMAAQRYYYEMAYSGAEPYGSGAATSATAAVILTALPVSMRVVPTAVYTGTFRLEGGASKTGIAAASLSLNQVQNQQILTAVTSSSLTAGWGFVMLANGTSAIKLSAEL